MALQQSGRSSLKKAEKATQSTQDDESLVLETTDENNLLLPTHFEFLGVLS